MLTYQKTVSADLVIANFQVEVPGTLRQLREDLVGKRPKNKGCLMCQLKVNRCREFHQSACRFIQMNQEGLERRTQGTP